MTPQTGPTVDVLVDVMAATFHKASELCSTIGGGNFNIPTILTTDGRKKVLADRKETAKLEGERIERDASIDELKAAMAAATESRDFTGLAKPMKRCKRAVDTEEGTLAAALDEADKLNKTLVEEKAERELQERLEKERVERESAGEELANAMEAAKESRDFGALAKPIKRAKKAVDFPADALGAAEALVNELIEEKKEKERQEAEDARLEKERIEREAACEELKAAVEAAKASRDAAPPSPQEGGAAAMDKASKSLDKGIKRCKKAVDMEGVLEALLAETETLKGELDETKKERDVEERLEKEKVEREAAGEELKEAIKACTDSRDPGAVVKGVKRCKKAVDTEGELAAIIEEGEALKVTCDEEKAAAAKAAKDEAAAAKADAAAQAAAAKAEEAAKKAAAKAEAEAEAAKAKAEAAAAAAEAAKATVAEADAS